MSSRTWKWLDDPGMRNWGLTYLAPIFAVVALYVGVPDIANSIEAARNEGTPGTFTSERAECSRGKLGGRTCTYYGTFRSDDSSVELGDVFIDDGVEEVNKTVPAQRIEDSRFDKVYELNSRDWVWVSLIVGGSVVYLGGWGWLFVRPLVRRRRVA